MPNPHHGFRLKPIRREVVNHPHERRGFAHVPPDPDDPRAGRIDVFYRLLPRHGVPIDRDDGPIVVVINGGPGIPASFYRPLDFDYLGNQAKPGALDRFKHLLKTHRVLLMDQRGTDGCSAPLDMDDPELDPNVVARLFSALRFLPGGHHTIFLEAGHEAFLDWSRRIEAAERPLSR